METGDGILLTPCEGALESALARSRHKWHYQETCDLAAAYGFGLCRNHPYRDGNKRAAFVAMVVSLELNARRGRRDQRPGIARADVAHFVLTHLADSTYPRKTVLISY